MSDDVPKVFQNAWKRVQCTYNTGAIASERGLQAALYAELRGMPDSKVICEPGWEIDGGRQVPDMAIVTGDAITHVFELKYVPHFYPQYKPDLSKLYEYARHATAEYDVLMLPATGHWDKRVPLAPDCALHFVAISQWDAAAVHPPSIAEYFDNSKWPANPFYLWTGAVGGEREPAFKGPAFKVSRLPANS